MLKANRATIAKAFSRAPISLPGLLNAFSMLREDLVDYLRNHARRQGRMTPEDKQALFRVAQWVTCNRKIVKTIRQLAETEENYLVIIREIDRVEGQLNHARTLGADATLTLEEWLITLEDFDWRCAYCQSKPFQVMSHMIPLPQGGTVPENCIPACYGCIRHRRNEHIRRRLQTYCANRKNISECIVGTHIASLPPTQL